MPEAHYVNKSMVGSPVKVIRYKKKKKTVAEELSFDMHLPNGTFI